MRAVRAGTISLILLLALIPCGISSESNEGVSLIQGESEEPGPFWILFSCKLESCPGMELSVIVDGESFHFSDSHHVEWSGIVNHSVEWELQGSEALGPEDIEIKTISNAHGGAVEGVDLPDIVPSPGQVSDWFSIDYSSVCQLNRCDKTAWSMDKVTFTGSLQNSSDEDALLVPGKFGDVVQISGAMSRNEVDIQIWSRGETKTLISSFPSPDLEPVLLDYPPESELWIRVVHSSEGDFSPYQLDIVRYDMDKEGPDGQELENPWNYNHHLYTNSTIDNVFRGHISTSDTAGDSILISIGSKVLVEVNCEFSGEISLDIAVHEIGGRTQRILEDLDHCPENIQMPQSATGVEFSMKSGSLSAWSIEVSPQSSGDGNLNGDAPDFLWTETGPFEYWTYLYPGSGSVSGNLGVGDSVDIFPMEITDENGSLIFIRLEIDSPVTYQIQELKQDNWQILNYTNGGIISLPKGIHAIRVEGLSPITGDVNYEFTVLYLGENIPDDGEFMDMSHLFANFYILIGFLMILPLLVVLWWNRSIILQRSVPRQDGVKYGIERLKLLRERLSQSVEDVGVDSMEIENALGKLGESPWDSILDEWGNPDLRHMTKQIEICAWRPNGGSFLIVGIRTFEKDWDLAAINLNSPEGSSLVIEGTYPSHLNQGGDIFLDSLDSHSKKFLRISIGGNPSSIELEVSGMVDGEPLAVVPRGALPWN